MVQPVFLSSRDLDGLAEPSEFVAAVRDAYRQRGDGAPTRPRTSLRSDDPAGLFNCYLAILPETGVMGGYVYAAGFGDADAWLLAPLFDAESGRPLALLDGSSMNTAKTGAAGAVGIDALAREDSEVLAVVGSGAQARAQVVAATTVREFTEVRTYSPTPEHRRAFAEDIEAALDVEARPVTSSGAATRGADVVITATNAGTPVVSSEDIDDGTHINAIGQYHPEKRELDAETIRRATYVPDLRERAFQDAGAFLLAVAEGAIDEDHIHAELGEVVAGHAAGRRSAEEVTVFDSGGTAIETTAVAALLYRRAMDEHPESSRPLDFLPASETYVGKRGDTADEL